MHKICITAHTGALRTKNNTLESAKAGLACAGVDCIEVDVRFLPDATPALGHDWVNAKSPKLEDVFKLMQNREASINLDLKEFTHISRVVALAGAYGLGKRAFFTGLREADCAKAQHCGLPYYLNGADVAAAKEVGAIGVNVHHKHCSKELVQAAHKENLLVSVFTVNRRRAMRNMVALGVDNITTRRPVVLTEICNHAI